MLTYFLNTSPPPLVRSVSGMTDCYVDSLKMLLQSLIHDRKEVSDFETTLANALPWQIVPLMSQVCEETDWDYGEMWIPSDHSTILELSHVWHIASHATDLTSLEQFHLCSEGSVLFPGEGLPGRVWLSGQAEQIADATAQSESYCLRNQLAKAFDISAGLGVPIITNGEVQSVLVFFKLKGWKYDYVLS